MKPRESHQSSWSQTHPSLYMTLLHPGHSLGLGVSSSLYLERIRSIVNVLDWHITPILRALAVGFTQLEGLRL